MRNGTYVVGCATVELAGMTVQLNSDRVVAGMVRGRGHGLASKLRLKR